MAISINISLIFFILFIFIIQMNPNTRFFNFLDDIVVDNITVQEDYLSIQEVILV